MLNKTARPTPPVFCPRLRLRKRNLVPVNPNLPSQSGYSKGRRLRALLEPLGNAGVPSNKPRRQHQQEES